MNVTVISHYYVEEDGYVSVLESMSRAPGVTLSVITPDRYKGAAFSRSLLKKSSDHFDIVAVPVCFPGRQGAFLYHPIKLKQAIKKLQPDIILHEQEVYALNAAQVARTAHRLHIPVIMFAYENVPRKLLYPRRLIRDYVLRKLSGLIVGSAGARDIHRNWGFTGHIAIIPQMGVNYTVETAHPGLRVEGTLNVIFAGRLVPEKGLECLIRAIGRLTTKLPVRCVIVGAGVEQERLEAMVKALSLEHAISFTGKIPMPQVASVLHQADVLVLPSKRTSVWEEQFGRILVEAMAQGTVVIGSRTGAIPEVIGTERLIFNEDDDACVAKLLEQLYSDGDFLQNSRRFLLDRAKAMYTNDELSRQRASFLSSIVESPLES